MRRRLTVLFIWPVSPSYMGGAERFLINISEYLVTKGHEVYIAHTNWYPHKKCQSNNILSLLKRKRIHLYKYNGVRLPWGAPVFMPFEYSNIQELLDLCELAYVYSYGPYELVASILKLFTDKPIILGIHLIDYSRILHRLYYRIIFHIISKKVIFHVLNLYIYSYLKKLGIKYVYYIPNGVDTSKFHLCNDPAKFSTFNILFTGRLTKDKGADLLAKIIIRLERISSKFEKSIYFNITGFGPLEDIILTLAKKYNNVEYYGFVSLSKLIRLYRNSQLFLMPSRAEGKPLRALEALSCGLPLIASKIPGVVDIFWNIKRAGYMVPVGDIEGYVKGLLKYYNLWLYSPQDYRDLNLTIRKQVIDRYDWHKRAQQLESLFLSVVEGIRL